MRIGILGTGNVGSALATGFSDAGYDVLLGSRDPSRPRLMEWVGERPKHRSIGDYPAAVEFGDIVIFAVPGSVVGNTIDIIGREAFDGKLIIDPTNPFGKNEQGETVPAYGNFDSDAELIQRELPNASVVKAFNQVIPPAGMLNPNRSNVDVMRLAGDDEDAKRQVKRLLEDFGWQVRDVGPLSAARALEHGVIERSTRPTAGARR